MKTGLKSGVILLLFLLGNGSAFAGPFSHAFPGRGERQARAAAQQDDRQQQQQGDPRRAALPGAPADAGANAANRPPPDQVRRMGGRMTVEERRALRRQINEAGHDIYAPKK